MDRKQLIELIEKTVKSPQNFDYDQYETEYLNIWLKLVSDDVRRGYNSLAGQHTNMEIPAIKHAKTQVKVTCKRMSDDDQANPNKKIKKQ